MDKLLHHIFIISVTSGENGNAQELIILWLHTQCFWGTDHSRWPAGCLIRCHVTFIPGDVSKITLIKTTHTYREDDRKEVIWRVGW